MTPYLFGKYCLLERVSVGGMAEVFRAKPLNAPDFNGYLALKRILPHLAEDDEFIMMFVDEAKLTVQLVHPNIVKIYELGMFQGSYYILMEYIAGKDLLTLQKRVRKRKDVIGIARSVYIAHDMARGLHHAHTAVDANGVPLNIIHRDVSPQNVLVDYLGHIKVIDFGIAKAAVQSTRTQVGVLKGKMGYMSPEQVMGLPLDRRSDVFAIGTVLWEMLTNRRLFNAENEFETMQLVRSAQVSAPSSENPEIPPDLDALVLKALAANRDERFQSAEELANALGAWLSVNPCGADNLSTWMREVFAEDLEEELSKRDEFAKIQTPDDIRRLSPSESVSLLNDDDDETADKTQIWEGDLPTPDDVDPLEFAAQHTVVQAGGFDIDAYLAEQRGLPAPQKSPNAGAPMGYPAGAPMGHQSLDVGFQSEGTQPGFGIPHQPVAKRGLTAPMYATLGVFLVLLIVAGALAFKHFGPDKSATGAVLVTAHPPTAQVRLNGAPFACTIPCRIENLGFGKHLVEVVEDGFDPVSRTLEISTSAVIPFDVVLVASGPKTGSVSVAFPDDVEIRVFVDGISRSREELEPAFDLPVGPHLIEVVAAGFKPFIKFVEVKAEPLVLNAAMTPVGFDMTIQAEVDSVVRVDGERLGTVPVQLLLDPYTIHDVEVSRNSKRDSRWQSRLALPQIASKLLFVNFEQKKKSLREKDFGWLTVSTGDDWFSVWIDGVDTGIITPIDATKRVPIEKGERVVSLRRGHEQHDITVDVRGGETTFLRENFTFEWK